MAAPTEHFSDPRINVVDFFKPDAMGRARRYVIDLNALELDNDLIARNVHVELRLSRAGAGVIAEGNVRADVELECVRTLDPFVYIVTADFTEQFRPTIDLATGREIAVEDPDEEPDYFPVDDSHEIDLREALRQVILVNLPMQPIKPGTDPVVLDELEPDEATNPFAALGALLHEERN
jgi:uncharacterized metal-binding protein YceD (DUF177 family)